MSKSAEINPDQAVLFEGRRLDHAVFQNGSSQPASQAIDAPRAEVDFDRLDVQGQTNTHTALGRLGIAREVDGEIYPERFPDSSVRRPVRRLRERRNLRARTSRELRIADQPPEHERFDPYK